MNITVTRPRRKALPSTIDNAESPDQLLLSSAICNGDDLGPFIRNAFASGKPDTLLQNLRRFYRSKQSEIEDVCRVHYEDFIIAVDDLRSLLSDVDSLKSSISDSNSQIQSVGGPLLTSVDAFLEVRNKCINITKAIDSLRSCIQLMEVCNRANFHISERNFYMALKCLDSIERDFSNKSPSTTLQRMLDKRIPAIRSYIQSNVREEFIDWLEDIREVSLNIGQLAIRQASAARQKEEELRIKQMEAEEHSPRDYVYALEEDEDDEYNGPSGFELTRLYRAHHIHQTLGAENSFKLEYFEKRKEQLTSDFQVLSKFSFLESHQIFFAQIAGFFIVEDRILRTGGGLITKIEGENLWYIALSKMCSVLEEQFSEMQAASHLLLIKDYVSLLGATMKRYGYPIDALLDALIKHKDKYHELLLSECRIQIFEALAAENFQPMYMKKEYEYSMNVLSFQLQASDIMPAFPYVAPFSSSVPDCCRIVRSFIEDSVTFLTYSGKLEFYDVVRKYLDRLLAEVLDDSLVQMINNSIVGVTQAMQMAANMVVFERACDYFFRHAAHLSGIPMRMVERERRQFPLSKSRDATETTLCGLIKQKVDGFLMLMENVNWMADDIDIPQGGNEYVNEVVIMLETLVSTAQQVLPVQILKRVVQEVLSHISEMIVAALHGESVERFTLSAVKGLEVDIQMLESFAVNQAMALGDESDADEFKSALVEARQLTNLLLSNHPENFVNPVIREKSYYALDYKKVVAISEKLKDQSSDRVLVGSFGSRVGAYKHNTKKKSLDTLIKRLKEVC